MRTAFGVGASPKEQRKATTFSLSCLTARPSCKETKDLMPEAYRDLSFEANHDESFKRDCEAYVKSIEVGPGPWSVESAFEADPFSLTTWDLAR